MTGAPARYHSRKVVRNCMAYELTRVAGRVLYQLHCSTQHVWEMPAEEWDSLPSQ